MSGVHERALPRDLGHPASLIPSQAPVNEIHSLVKKKKSSQQQREARKCAERGILPF